MARAIGRATMKCFGCPATGQGVVGFTAIMFAGKIAAIDRTAAMTTDGTIAGMTGEIIATTGGTTAATKSDDN